MLLAGGSLRIMFYPGALWSFHREESLVIYSETLFIIKVVIKCSLATTYSLLFSTFYRLKWDMHQLCSNKWQDLHLEVKISEANSPELQTCSTSWSLFCWAWSLCLSADENRADNTDVTNAEEADKAGIIPPASSQLSLNLQSLRATRSSAPLARRECKQNVCHLQLVSTAVSNIFNGALLWSERIKASLRFIKCQDGETDFIISLSSNSFCCLMICSFKHCLALTFSVDHSQTLI